MRCALSLSLLLTVNALAAPPQTLIVPEPPLPREELANIELDEQTARQANQHLDRLVELKEAWQTSLDNKKPNPAALDAAERTAQTLSQAFPGSVFDALAAFHLAHIYECQRRHGWALAQYQQIARRLGGTTYGSIALVLEAEYRLRYNLDLDAVIRAAEQIAKPAEPTPDERSRGDRLRAVGARVRVGSAHGWVTRISC